MKKHFLIYLTPILFFGLACQPQKESSVFTLLTPEQTKVNFSNDLVYDSEFNILKYRNFYNGGGVAIGDVNNDGLPDLYFTGNQVGNKLFLNKGNFEFEDITEKAQVQGQRAWSTGVAMADVNGDGLLDIYVCNSGDVEGDNKENELFINNGDLTFTESAKAYNVADPGFSTHASFFDFDKDGDLDVYILNNSFQAIETFDLRRNERPKRDKLGGDKLMRNDNGKFVDISEEAGIYGSIIGFGLGVTIGDVNGDAWDDIFISNDFFERDYLYINNQNGGFDEVLTESMNSISGASMGADMADINNNGRNDIFVTDMLPYHYERIKSVTTFEDWNRYQYGVKNGYYHQFTRNVLQINNGDGTFSENGRMAGVEGTDWSWGALIFDMDNDGYKDLYVANGIYQDLTDQDFLQYASSEEIIKTLVSEDGVDYEGLISLMPTNPIANFGFKNIDGVRFENQTENYGLETPSFSNGAAYADLDNDGDLDLVVNNVNMQAFIYRNESALREDSNYIRFKLSGEGKNTFAYGTKIYVESASGDVYYIENQPIRGFQSSMEPIPFLGLKSDEALDIKVVWPSGKTTLMEGVMPNKMIELTESEAKNTPSILANKEAVGPFKTLAELDIIHKKNSYTDFDVDRSVYIMKSTYGPKISSGDVNGDGFADLYMGGSKGEPGKLLLGSAKGFQAVNQVVFSKDAAAEDGESVFADFNGDGHLDLMVTSGGIEFSNSAPALMDRLYFNDGKGNFTKSESFFPINILSSTNTVSAGDFDGDGDLDLFVGEGTQPLKQGMPQNGYLLVNDGKGNFENQTEALAPELMAIGTLSASLFSDVDSDGDLDLVLTGEYMGIEILINDEGKFSKKNGNVSELKGWWNAITPTDINGDGHVDFVVGNHGLNSRFKASKDEPIIMYVSDFDQNGTLDPILSKTHADGNTYPYALRHNLIDQIKPLKKVLTDYHAFKKMTVEDIFGADALKASTKSEANHMASVLLINDGGGNFEVVDLPDEAQISPVYAVSSYDFDNDGDLDIIIGGNIYGVKPEIGRYDSSYGLYLENVNGKYIAKGHSSGFKFNGEIRDFEIVENSVIVARNNDSMLQIQF